MTAQHLRKLSWSVLAATALLGAGCQDQLLADGLPNTLTCTSCHGVEGGDNPAPPVSLDGSTDTTTLGVGAHDAHVLGGLAGGPLECSECHLVPTAVDDPGHVDTLPAEVTWGPRATAHGAQPVWDRKAKTCSNVYCHGTTLEGGAATTPRWTLVDGTQSACDACHGNAPPAPHPVGSNCAGCHPGTVLADGTIDLAGGQHIDGMVQAVTDSCAGCHGSSPDSPAPPRSVSGATDTTVVEVGAHTAHLTSGLIAGAMACSECHIVPASAVTAGHIDAAPAELVWGDLATGDGTTTPQWDRVAAQCSNVYCHGSTLSGGTKSSPIWTLVDGTQATCDSCHGSPPPAPHPTATDCWRCHAETVNADGTINIAGGKHLDGILQPTTLDCGSCHGTVASLGAPPAALDGSTATTALGVGAHAAHLATGSVRAPVACSECHQVPDTIDAVNHLGDLPAELTWGELATHDGDLAPEWTRAQAQCSNVYCHGATLSGGNLKSPVWTLVDGTASACDACHGSPPAAPHPPETDCARCHAGTVLAGPGDPQIDIAGGLHIDGTVQFACNACHGNDVNVAPPKALDGATATTSLGVGAHQAHLTDGPFALAFACSDCHDEPANFADPGHRDNGIAEVVWSDLATGEGVVAPVWNRESATCSNVYCHGATMGGGANTTPLWTKVDGTQASCGTCHGAPPPPPHVAVNACWLCHPRTVNSDGTINLGTGTHINGIVEFGF